MVSNSIGDMLEESLTQLERKTQQFILQLDETDYEEVERFVEERQDHVDHLLKMLDGQVITVEQKQMLKRILSHDAQINQRMQFLKEEAKDWLVQRSRAKSQRNAYDSKYAPDSYLMDRRK
ncbi:flagellar protein FliT [Paenibacillus sp. NPDC056933]|uniref:flagellar protein FliT n=1 Tax=Paenibacillus sp. NPDC056933 TaxID=3345968 RepID=UPI00362FC600